MFAFRNFMTRFAMSGGMSSFTMLTRHHAILPHQTKGMMRAFVEQIRGPGPKRNGSDSGTVAML
jgi:hypothetical protein